MVSPLLELIAKYTGYTAITIIGGAPDGEKYSVGVVNYGVADGLVPKNMTSVDPEGFRTHFVNQFVKFLRVQKGMF